MNDRTLNKELILQVADKIEAHPISYDQTRWHKELNQEELDTCAPFEVPECGSAFCLAGHVCWLAEDGKYRDLLFNRPGEWPAWYSAFATSTTFILNHHYVPSHWYKVPAERSLGIDSNLGQIIFDAKFLPVPPHDIVSALRQWATTEDPKGCMIP